MLQLLSIRSHLEIGQYFCEALVFNNSFFVVEVVPEECFFSRVYTGGGGGGVAGS